MTAIGPYPPTPTLSFPAPTPSFKVTIPPSLSSYPTYPSQPPFPANPAEFPQLQTQGNDSFGAPAVPPYGGLQMAAEGFPPPIAAPFQPPFPPPGSPYASSQAQSPPNGGPPPASSPFPPSAPITITGPSPLSQLPKPYGNWKNPLTWGLFGWAYAAFLVGVAVLAFKHLPKLWAKSPDIPTSPPTPTL